MEYLQQFIEYAQTNYPKIVEYFIICLAYFLIILFRSKIGNTTRNLTAIFKEKAEHVDNTDIALRKDIQLDREYIKLQLAESEKQYAAAVAEYMKASAEISALKSELSKVERALVILLEDIEDVETEEVEDNAELHSVEEA